MEEQPPGGGGGNDWGAAREALGFCRFMPEVLILRSAARGKGTACGIQATVNGLALTTRLSASFGSDNLPSEPMDADR